VKRDTPTTSGNQSINYITECDLYRLITHSRLELAVKFEAWVFEDVLPSIRKHGAYITPQTMEEMIANPDFTIKLLTELKSEREQKTALAAQIERDKPKVQFADALATSKDLILVRGLAKLLRQNGVLTGEKRLFQYLRDKGYLLQFGTERNMPTQYSMEHGLFEIRERPLTYNGETRIARTPMVTAKGQSYFLRKLRGQEEAV
jgi:phage antirepressor YoqD-like protein